MKIHHVGFLTSRLSRSLDEFIRLGYRVEREAAYDNIRDVHIAFVVNGDYRVELIEPASDSSPLKPLLAKYKNTPYHICYEVTDLDAETARLSSEGYTVFRQAEAAPCLEGRRVVFLLHRAMGMIELLETGQREE